MKEYTSKKSTIIFVLTILTSILFVSGCTGKSAKNTLSQYITNYDEVNTILCEELNATEIKTSQSNNFTSDINTLEAFGNGNYWITANDIDFGVHCENHIATIIEYNNGAVIKTIRTPTYEKMKKEEMEKQDNNLKGVEVDPSLIHIPESE